MLLVAHAGHWLMWILYAVPVIVVGTSIVISLVRQRRERDAGPSSSEPPA